MRASHPSLVVWSNREHPFQVRHAFGHLDAILGSRLHGLGSHDEASHDRQTDLSVEDRSKVALSSDERTFGDSQLSGEPVRKHGSRAFRKEILPCDGACLRRSAGFSETAVPAVLPRNPSINSDEPERIVSDPPHGCVASIQEMERNLVVWGDDSGWTAMRFRARSRA